MPCRKWAKGGGGGSGYLLIPPSHVYSNSFTCPLFLLDRDFLREKINESREAKDRLLPLEPATINSSVCPLRRF